MSQVPIEFKLPLLVHRCSGSWDLMWLMSLFFDLFVQLVSDFRFRLQLWRLKWRLKWHRDSPRCLVIFAYDNMMHCTFLLAWVVSWKQLQYPSLRQVFQAPLSGNMAHGSTKEELWRAKGTIPVMTYDITFGEKGIQTTIQTLYQRLVRVGGWALGWAGD